MGESNSFNVGIYYAMFTHQASHTTTTSCCQDSTFARLCCQNFTFARFCCKNFTFARFCCPSCGSSSCCLQPPLYSLPTLKMYVNAVNLRWVFELVIYLDRRPAYTRTGDWPNLEVRQGHKLPCSLLRKAWEASSSSITLWKILLVSNIASTGCSRIFSRSSGAEGGLGEN